MKTKLLRRARKGIKLVFDPSEEKYILFKGKKIINQFEIRHTPKSRIEKLYLDVYYKQVILNAQSKVGLCFYLRHEYKVKTREQRKINDIKYIVIK